MFTEKESLKKLDDTLDLLLKGNFYKSLAELVLDNSNLGEAQQIIDKLIQDKRAASRGIEDVSVEDLFNTKNYSITFEGKFFRECGGYVDTYHHGKREDFRQTLALWLTAVGTALAGVYGLVEMIKYLLKSFSPCR